MVADFKKIDWTLFSDREVEDIVDKGLRHRSGVEPIDYLAHWIWVGRQFAYATHDDGWGEFEKEFAIIVKRMIAAGRRNAELKTTCQELIDALMGNLSDAESVAYRAQQALKDSR